MERFDIFVARKGIASSSEKAEPSAATPNGQSQHDHRTSPSVPLSTPQSSSPKKRNVDGKEPSEEPSKTPPSKKRKSDNDTDADAVLAARLQAEENLRARPTRGARTRKPPPAKKKSKSKTSKKVNAEDDSELESSPETNKKEVNRTGGFHVSFSLHMIYASALRIRLGTNNCLQKPLNLSPALSTLLNGEVAVRFPTLDNLDTQSVTRSNACTALATADGEETMAIYPCQRSPRSERSTSNSMR